jgi:hypothetical protein
VEYGDDTSYGQSTILDTTMVTAHAVHITGLIASHTYHYRVKSTNAVPLTQTSSDATFITTAAPAGDLMSGLISYWKFDETTGMRNDAHGPNHFTVHEGTGGETPITGTPGKIGNCVNLPQVLGGDSGGYLQAADDLSQRMTGDFTITCWFWVEAVEFYSSLPSMLSMWLVGNMGYCLLFNGLSWVWQFSVSGDGATQMDCTIDGPDSTRAVRLGPDPLSGWHFVCAQYEAATGTMTLSIDNGAVFPPATKFAGFTGQIFQSTAPLQIGAFDTYRRTFAHIDETALYGRLLTPTEIAMLAAGTVTYPFS